MVDRKRAWGRRACWFWQFSLWFLVACCSVLYSSSGAPCRTWGKWAGPENDIYSVMKYEHGTGCWQGPNRATTVSPASSFLHHYCFLFWDKAHITDHGCLSGLINMWERDHCDIHLRAQPLWVPDGVHHPSYLQGTPQLWFTFSARRAVDALHVWVAFFSGTVPFCFMWGTYGLQDL